MKHAITLGDFATLFFILVGLAIAGFGGGKFFFGYLTAEPRFGAKAGKQGCVLLYLGACVIIATMFLSGCATAPQYRDRIVEVDKPVAVQPIKASDVPPLPGQLGKRPSTASQAADAALAGRCDAIAFVLRAYPLLLLSAGLPPAQAPHYSECEKK